MKKRNDIPALCRETEIDVLARTIWGEARGEGTIGMQAVACVVLNRLRVAKARGRYWWGNSIISICRKPYQFSAWNRNDPNYRKMLRVDDGDPYYMTARRLARRAVYGMLEDPTGGATHYHSVGITAIWAHGEKPCAVIGDHIFYKLVDA